MVAIRLYIWYYNTVKHNGENAVKQATYTEHVMCMMPPVLVERLKRVASEEGSNMSEFIRTAVRKELREHEVR